MNSIPDGFKKCSKCGEVKALDEFYNRKSATDGKCSSCKVCKNAAQKDWCSRNQERRAQKKRESSRKWREEHVEQRSVYLKEWRASHAERVRELNKQWYSDPENRERSRLQHLEYRKANPDKYRERANKRYHELKDDPNYISRRRSTERAWAKNNPDKVRAKEHRRQARHAGASGNATAQQIALRAMMFGNRCYICGGAYEEVDHVIPLSKGGTNWPANLRPICKSCNSSKGNRDWRKYVKHKHK